MMRVFHRINYDPSVVRARHLRRAWPLEYECVAVVHGSTDIETAFRKTNSVRTAWWENRGVESFKTSPIRSTSIGDVVQINGRSFMVDAGGWMEVTQRMPRGF